MNTWYHQSIASLVKLLASDVAQGLTNAEATNRLIYYGPNKLQKGKRYSALTIFMNQFKSLIIWVLIGAAAISTTSGEIVRWYRNYCHRDFERGHRFRSRVSC